MTNSEKKKTLHTFYIAGVKFHQAKMVMNELEEGISLVMTPEPTNKYDPNAIKIEFLDKESNQIMLGYVPKKISSQVSAALEIGTEIECILVKLSKTAKPWEQLEVDLRG